MREKPCLAFDRLTTINRYLIAACLGVSLIPGCDSADAKLKPPTISFTVVSVKRHKGPDTINARYPKFSGPSPSVPALNGAVKKLLDARLVQRNEECPACKGTYDCDFHTGVVTPEVISMRFTFSHYYEGTSHGEDHPCFFNYRTIPKLKEIKINDLVDGKDGLHKLSLLIVSKLRTKLPGIQTESDLEVSALDNFSFDANGVTWKWGAYEIGPYTAGCPEITLSFAELKRVSQKFSELQRLAKQ
jgi:Protein of unknown function (DUF3298)